MALVVGIDEVGYGPKLGPLIVAGFGFRVPEVSIDLWKALSPAVSSRPARTKLPVLDSKDLYSTSAGIKTLEPTALSFLALLPERPGATFRRLLENVALAPPAPTDPWYRDADFDLPIAADRADLDARAAALWKACLGAGVMAHGARAAWIEPAEFNRTCTSERNKSDLLFAQACKLVKALLDGAPGEEAIVRIGKQGGRRLYLAGLVREFGTVWVHGETPDTSRYEFRRDGRRVILEFLMDGENRDFALSLASIVGKYLREGAMRLFNAYWARQREGLRATAGYGLDARRFWREIEPHLDRLSIAPDAVLRRR
jgi:ribonuclease HII